VDGLIDDQGRDTKAHAQNAHQDPRVRTLTFEPRRPGPIVCAIVLASCHDAACITPISITQSGTFVVLVAREALFAIEEDFIPSTFV
jgi:hypothetical protein